MDNFFFQILTNQKKLPNFGIIRKNKFILNNYQTKWKNAVFQVAKYQIKFLKQSLYIIYKK
ncbi:hypothetical protein pb186bvf_010804 [Paramecium bursaria]